jgi:tetratricopeptide (TPR) repeat protein
VQAVRDCLRQHERCLIILDDAEEPNGTFSMHRLVQAVARDRMNDDARKRWVEAAKIVNDASPFDVQNVPANWSVCACLLPHALAAADHAAAQGIVLEPSRRIFNQAAF